METGVARSGDIELEMRLIDECLSLGRTRDAVYLWINIADRAAMETTSLRERYGLTATSYGQRLAQLLRLDGLERRASLVENMLAAMEKPDRNYL